MGRFRSLFQHLSASGQWLRPALAALRTTPYLGLLSVCLGLAGSLAVAWHMAGLYTGPGGGPWQLKVVQGAEELRQFVHDFFTQWMELTFLLLLPALALGFIRLRGTARLLPLALLSLGLFVYWIYGDLHDHYLSTAASNLGETPSLPTYYGKLFVTSLAMLSPTLIGWLYLKGTVLDRYVVRSFLTPFALCFLGLMTLFIFFDFTDNGKDLLEGKFGLRQILFFYLVQTPKFLVEIIDISLLLAVLYSLGRLSRHNEIISMVTAGISIPRILLPLFFIGLFAGVITMACNYQWAPEADRKKSDLIQMADDASAGRRASRSRTNAQRVAYMNREDHRFWFLQEVPIDISAQNKIKGVEVHELNEDGTPKRSIFSKSAFWLGVDPPRWIFYQARVIEHSKDPLQNYKQRDLAKMWEPGWRETPWRLLSESSKLPAQFLTVPQLASYLKSNHEFPEARLASYRTWWHDRLARPLRCLIVVLFAAPLGLVFSRRGLMGSVASTILLYFGMYFLTAIFLRLGETHKLPALMAAWSVNILFAAIGLLVLWQRSTNTDLKGRLLAFLPRKKNA